MSKLYIQVSAFLLVPLIAFDTASAAAFAVTSLATPPSVQQTSIRKTLFEQEALNEAASFIVRPALMARIYSARTYAMVPVRFIKDHPDFGWDLAFMFATALILRGLGVHHAGDISLGMGAMRRFFGLGPLTPEQSEVKRRESNEYTQRKLWGEYSRERRDNGYNVAGLDLDSPYFQESRNWGAPRQIGPLALVSYHVIGQLLDELELGASHLDLAKADSVTRAIVAAAHAKGPISEHFLIRQSDPSSNAPSQDFVATYSFVNPYLLKPLLIGLQTGRFAFSSQMNDAEIQAAAAAFIAQGPFDVPEATAHVIQNGFPKLPSDLSARRGLLRDYLVWLAQSPASPFEVHKIDEVLTDKLLSSLPEFNSAQKAEDASIMDPYSWDFRKQRAKRIGVLPIHIAIPLGACQLAVNAFVQLSSDEQLMGRKLLMVVRTRHAAYGGTISIFGGRRYVPGVDMEQALKKRVWQQLGVELDPQSDTVEEWERIRAMEAPVYVNEDGTDSQLRITYIYHPGPVVVSEIEKRQAALEELKLQFNGPDEFEAYLNDQTQHGKLGYGIRAMIDMLVGDLLYFKGQYALKETYQTGSVTTPVPLNPDLLERLIANRTSVVRKRLAEGRRLTSDYWAQRVRQADEGRQKDPEVRMMVEVNLMQSRWRPFHEVLSPWGLGGLIEFILAPLVEEFENHILGRSTAQFVAAHEESTHVRGLGWISPEHPAYPAALTAIQASAQAVRDALDPLMIGRIGRFALAVTAHVWLSSIKPRLRSIPSLGARYAGFSA